MKMRILFLLTLPLLLSNFVYTQTMHVVEASNFVFTPSNLTIEVNDTVRWINTQGNHNVIADDASFTSGAPSTDPWVFDKVFTAVGSNPYYCVNHGATGGIGMSGVITVQTPTGITGNDLLPTKFELQQNYPNPFNPTTIIRYDVSKSGKIKLSIFNSIGEEVALLVDGIVEIGAYEVNFDATNLTSGIYFYRLQSNDNILTKKMTLIR